AGPDLLRPLQPQGAGGLRAPARHAADARRLLHAPGGPEVLSGGGPAAGRAARRPGRLGAQGHLERGRLGEVLQRPDHPRVRGIDLERGPLSGVLTGPGTIPGRRYFMGLSPLAGKPAPKEMLVDLVRLEREYFERKPDLADPDQLVAFGTSGHRGTSL